ncbi:6973_t:CDS:1, partial [Ambispora leptoticha]
NHTCDEHFQTLSLIDAFDIWQSGQALTAHLVLLATHAFKPLTPVFIIENHTCDEHFQTLSLIDAFDIWQSGQALTAHLVLLVK